MARMVNNDDRNILKSGVSVLKFLGLCEENVLFCLLQANPIIIITKTV